MVRVGGGGKGCRIGQLFELVVLNSELEHFVVAWYYQNGKLHYSQKHPDTSQQQYATVVHFTQTYMSDTMSNIYWCTTYYNHLHEAETDEEREQIINAQDDPEAIQLIHKYLSKQCASQNLLLMQFQDNEPLSLSNDENMQPQNDEHLQPRNDEPLQPPNDEHLQPQNNEPPHPPNDKSLQPRNNEPPHPPNDKNMQP
ncbi:hypothetical protein BDR05DRAFT_953048 [Suillus weaverae]|nr:hypothetical protein BDR05DRAFT_953048 [Suillus weaverae]